MRREDRPIYDHTDLQQWIEGSVGTQMAVGVASAAEQQRVEFVCERCKERWFCPRLDQDRRREVAGLVRRAQLLDVFALFRSIALTPAAAKQTMLHITNTPGKCNRCSRALTIESEQIVCCCRALNLNW